MKKQPAVQDKKEIQKSQKNIELKGLLFLAAGLFLLASYAGLPTGFIGQFLHDAMTYGFGLGAIVFPFIFKLFFKASLLIFTLLCPLLILVLYAVVGT